MESTIEYSAAGIRDRGLRDPDTTTHSATRTQFQPGPVHLRFHDPQQGEHDETYVSVGARSNSGCCARYRSDRATAKCAIGYHSVVCIRQVVPASRLAGCITHSAGPLAVDQPDRSRSAVSLPWQMIHSVVDQPGSSPGRRHVGVTSDRSATGPSVLPAAAEHRRCQQERRDSRTWHTHPAAPTESTGIRTPLTAGNQHVHTMCGKPRPWNASIGRRPAIMKRTITRQVRPSKH